jgi:splicing factor 45
VFLKQTKPLNVWLQVGTELTKYGTVTDVMIFEVTTPGYPPEEAVRIFAQFDRTEAATRALVDLQGRFFGGRQVRRLWTM